MTSIINYCKNNKINFTASALSVYGSYSPYNVFDSSKTFFISQQSSAGQWWQVTFAIPFLISSYTIGDYPGEDDWLLKWKISYSYNGKDFIHIRDDSHPDIRGNVNFKLNPAINCKTFRITHIENTYGSNGLYFSYFNCFGSIKKMKRNTCNFIAYKYKLISKELTMKILL